MKLWIILLLLTSLASHVWLQVTESNSCEEYLDIVIVLDSSGSIRDNNPLDGSYDNWELALTFVQDLVQGIGASQSTNRFGLVFFSGFAINKFFLNTYGTTQELVNAIGGMKDDFLGSDTNTQEGIMFMHKQQFVIEKGDRPDIINFAVIITDGVSTIMPENTIPAAEAARQDGIIIISIGVSNRIDEDELKGMSSMPQKLNETYFIATDFNALDLVKDKIVSLSRCPVITPVPTTRRPVTMPTTTTTASIPPSTTTARTSPTTTLTYFTATFPTTTITTEGPVTISKDCTQNLDIVIVLDSSGSIRDNNPLDGAYDNWNLVIEFVQDLVRSIGASSYTNRFGLVLYSGIAFNKFYLNTYSSTQEVIDAIELLKYDYLGSDTNTQEGIIYMHKEQFVSQNGDRPDVTNLAIIITDGVSTIIPENTIPAAEAARKDGINIVSIGVSNRIDENELRAMSSMPQIMNENYFTTTDFSTLDLVKDIVVSKSCQVTTTPATPPTTSAVLVTPDMKEYEENAVLYVFVSLVGTLIIALVVLSICFMTIKKKIIQAEKCFPEENLQPPKSPIIGYTCHGTNDNNEFPCQNICATYPMTPYTCYTDGNKQELCVDQEWPASVWDKENAPIKQEYFEYNCDLDEPKTWIPMNQNTCDWTYSWHSEECKE